MINYHLNKRKRFKLNWLAYSALASLLIIRRILELKAGPSTRIQHGTRGVLSCGNKEDEVITEQLKQLVS